MEIFQQERESHQEIARGRYPAEKPYMVILEQYRDQLQELIGSNSTREYIEQQESTASNTSEGIIGQVGSLPGPRLPGESMGKVRKFRLANGQEVYAKRVNPLRTRYPEEEIMISLEVDKSLKKVSPYFGVQEFIGVIYDQGAFYLLSLDVVRQQDSLKKKKEPKNKLDLYKFKPQVKDILMPLGLDELEPFFIYKDGKINCIFLDFETLPYRPVKDANKTPEALKSSSAVEGEEKSSALPKKIKEAEIMERLKTFSLNNPDWLGERLKNKITEDYHGLSVLEPVVTDQYGQWNDVLRLSDKTMDELKARLNKEEANEYFYLPIITKHWVNILTSQYWVNSYTYKVIIAKKPALEKALNYTYRDIIEGNNDVLLLWEFTVRPENQPPTIILEQQGLYKVLRGQGFISEAYPLFVQCLAEKFPGWQVEGEFENPSALVLFERNFNDPRPLNSIKSEEPDNAKSVKSVIWNARIPPFNPSSSVDNPGGIDLTALPITTQFVLNKPLVENMPVAGSGLSLTINLDNELRQIQSMLNTGIMPSSERIKEYALASSSLKPEDYRREIDRLLGCIADIFRLEEEKAKPPPQALKEVLILLEADKPAPELQLALAGKR